MICLMIRITLLMMANVLYFCMSSDLELSYLISRHLLNTNFNWHWVTCLRLIFICWPCDLGIGICKIAEWMHTQWINHYWPYLKSGAKWTTRLRRKMKGNAFHSKNSYTSFLTFNSNKKGFMPEIPSRNNHSLKASYVIRRDYMSMSFL